jgi:hypothetical protein
MGGRNIFYQAVIGRKKNIGQQNGDMCFTSNLQKIYFIKDNPAVFSE